MVDMNAITKPPWPDPLSQLHRKPPSRPPQATWPSLSLLSLSLSLAIAANAKLLVFSVNRGGSSSLSSGLGFFFFCCDRCLKELGMAFCYWFDLILGWIFFLWVHGGGVGGCLGLVWFWFCGLPEFVAGVSRKQQFGYVLRGGGGGGGGSRWVIWVFTFIWVLRYIILLRRNIILMCCIIK